MKNKDFDLHSIVHELHMFGHAIKRYAAILLFILFAISYGFIVLRINMLSSAPVTTTDTTTASPSLRIDANAAKQLQSLKDNSTNVQTLFKQDRTNPFQE